jgi:hypothetical protein
MKSKQIGFIIGGIALLVIVAAGAYFGAQMVNQPEEAAAAGSGGRVIEMVSDDGSGPRPFRVSFKNAPELPDQPSEIGGVLKRQADNSLIIGTGTIIADVDVNGDTGERKVQMNSDGPEVEVVITRDTQLYKDVTGNPAEGPIPESGEKVVQQKVEPVDSLAETVNEQNVEVQVWGERRGERVIADFLLYRIVNDF